MKIMKRLAIAVAVYVAIVIGFESLIGFFQPADQTTLVITTLDEDGAEHDRVLAHLGSAGQLYVAVNHWPRAWYGRALENPNVKITLEEGRGDYTAVPVPADGEEHGRVDTDNALPFAFRVLTGFPPRYFLRLESRSES
jgi:hypothetical protein